MKRRVFFIRLWKSSLGGLAALAFAARQPARAGADIQVGRTLYRGTADGRILESTDLGETWRQVVSFGRDYSILKLAYSDQLYAQVAFRDARFSSSLSGGRRRL